MASIVLAVTLAAAEVCAQAGGSVDALLDEGVRLRSQGQDEAALGVFRRAWEAAHAPEALAQVALAEQALGLWVEAARDLATARESTADPWVARHRDDLALAASEIGRHVGRVEVRARSPGARLRVNGVDHGGLPLASPLVLVIGTQSLEVTAPGRVTARRVVDVRPGDDLREEFDLAPVPPPVAAPLVERSPRRTARAARPGAGWATASFVAAGTLLAGGLGALAWRESVTGDFNAARMPQCMVDPSNGDRVYGGAACEAWASDRGTANALMIAGLAGAGAFAAVGVALLVTRPSVSSRAGLRCVPGPASVACAVSF